MQRSMFKRESKAGKHHFSKDLIYSLKLFVFIMTLSISWHSPHLGTFDVLRNLLKVTVQFCQLWFNKLTA